MLYGDLHSNIRNNIKLLATQKTRSQRNHEFDYRLVQNSYGLNFPTEALYCND